jgi:hypothetical protein
MSDIRERIAEACDPVERCPVCQSTEFREVGRQQRNRYSEEIAALLDVDEDELLGAIRDVRCQACGLGFKDWWFKPEFYYKVFVEAAPVHPRGWDAALDIFNPHRFVAEVERLGRAVAEGDRPLINRQRRTVTSYLDNIPRAQRQDPDVQGVLERFRAIDLDSVGSDDLAFLENDVAPLMVEPKPFGRFQGFDNDELEALIRRHTPSFRSYAEVACPLWGLLPRFAGSDVETWFLKDEDRAFWGPGCCTEAGQCCFDYARDVVGVDHVTDLSAMTASGARVDMLALLNYLDHLGDPLGMLRRARQVAERLLVVLVPDTTGGPGVIQHHTSFDRAVMDRMAAALGMQVTEALLCGEDPEPDFVAYVIG